MGVNLPTSPPAGTYDHFDLASLAWEGSGSADGASHTFNDNERNGTLFVASWNNAGDRVSAPVTNGSEVIESEESLVSIVSGGSWVSPLLLNQDDTHTIVARPDGAVAWTNMPAAETAFFGQSWSFIANTENKTQIQISGFRGAASLATAKLGAQFSIDGGVTWRWFDDGSATAGTGIGSHAPYYTMTTGTNVSESSGWTNLFATAISDEILVRIVGSDGDGAIDPSWRTFQVRFR